MLKSLKKELKNLIKSTDELFRRLKEEVLDSSSELYDDLIMIEAQYADMKRSGFRGTINFENKNLTFNTINDALLNGIINYIEVVDLSSNYRQKIASHEYVPVQESYTCDRIKQTGHFEEKYYDDFDAANRKHFYYLYGDAQQSHKSLFERLGYDLSGLPFDWQQGNFDPLSKVHFFDARLQRALNPRSFQLNLLRALHKHFQASAMRGNGLLQSKLSNLLTSPKIKNFSSGDFVFMLLTMSEDNWNKEMVPQVVKSFIEGFCNSELPESAPTFVFFFGIEYRKDNAKIEVEVAQALNDGDYLTTLPLLSPVAIADVREWFGRYEMLMVDGMNADETARHHFPNQEKIDMKDVELKLKKIIEDYDKGYLITKR